MAFLKFIPAKGDEEKEIELEGELVTLGRGPNNTVTLEDQAASRNHAEIAADAPGFIIKDLGSSNGTWVNRERIESHRLIDGDEIKIGGTTLVFSDPHPEEATVLVDLAGIQDAEVTHVQSIPAPVSPQAPPSAPPVQPPPPPVAPAPAVPPQVVSPPPMPAAPVAPPPPPVAAAPAAIRASSAKASGEVALPVGETAGFGIRLGAFLIDSIILSIAVMIIMIPTGVLVAVIAPKSQGLAAVMSILGWLLGMAVWIGYLLVPWARSGITPGKKLLKLKIVGEDGVEPLGYKKAGLRFLGYMASGMILGVGFIMVAFIEGHKGLHDMIAGTRVIKTK
jgi:pSer/pThr/pTyr-binding forkhead associated (FHA) protein/uncharacterized RDD family membrane protein YckC